MRILVVTIVHHPEDARILHRQIRALLDAGHEVTYVAPFADCAVDSAGTPAGLTAVTVPRASGRRRLAAIRAGRAALRAHADRSDLVLLHDPELLLSVAGLRDLPPVVWDVHEDTAAAVSLKPWLPQVVRPLAARAVTAAERLAERRHRLLLAEPTYQQRFRRPHPVVPNTTYVPEQVPPPGDDRVIYVGHLTAARGAAELVELGRLVGDEVRVVLVGPADGATRVLLEQAHADGVVDWRGFVPNAEALALVEGALAGLSLLHDEPNYRHSTPTKVLEYMGRGVPVITTPTPPAQDLVERHSCGLVVPFGDAQAAAEAVRQLRADAATRTAMGKRGHQAALREYAWPVHAAQFVARLEEWAAAGSVQKATTKDR